ncbi:hypothetical protein C9J48_00575 [Photobacterium profundum]|uniref:Uncharacterized protein n=1 Tax=Photobacterium profundum 3TCK TaxID=314280 RepID=Q1YY25_9GAMM|nr:hypothetical protein [Photobacterium profundum]EAS41180.1 hypothetical protein P3TCK_18704 [Photobacterium profundum 3TCK]PSV63997.1 hypothetical protein C9J48_00575 [Photobacterium profundum]
MSNVVNAEPYLYIDGYGETEQQATIDAKQQLALRIYSKVEVKEKNIQSKVNGDINTSYELQSEITTLPIEIQYMEISHVTCEYFTCQYQFKIDTNKWFASLKRDVAEYHNIASDYLSIAGQQWRDLKQLDTIKSNLLNSEQSLIILSSLGASDLFLLENKQSRLLRRATQYENQFQISFRSASDRFSSEVKTLLSASKAASSSGNITVYIKASMQKGKQGNHFVAKQTVVLQIFEANNLGVVVAQKQLSEMASSPNSIDSALKKARQKIIKILKTHSIYSLLD